MKCEDDKAMHVSITKLNNGEIKIKGDPNLQEEIRKILTERNEAISAINSIGFYVKKYNMAIGKGNPEGVAYAITELVAAVLKVIVLKPAA